MRRALIPFAILAAVVVARAETSSPPKPTSTASAPAPARDDRSIWARVVAYFRDKPATVGETADPKPPPPRGKGKGKGRHRSPIGPCD